VPAPIRLKQLSAISLKKGCLRDMEVVDPFGMAYRKCSLLKLFNPPLSSPSLAALGVVAKPIAHAQPQSG